MPARRQPPWMSVLAALAAIGATTAATRLLSANANTAGFVLLLAVLFLTVRFGFTGGATAAIAGTLAYNFFFLPPLHTFTIADPANWVALAAFGLTAWVTGRLVAAERRRAEEAESKHAEIERLFELSFLLFTPKSRLGRLEDAAARILDTVEARTGALYLEKDGALELAWPAESPPPEVGLDFVQLERALQDGAIVERTEGPLALRIAPIGFGGRLAGALLVIGGSPSHSFLASAARLLAISMERDRLLEESARGRASAESDRLKTALILALAHDLRSPLSAMAIGLEALLRDTPRGGQHDRLHAVARERERLGRRIDQLLAAARLEAGLVRPRAEPIHAGELFRSAREHLELVLADRDVRVRIDPDCPEVVVDAALAVEALVNLLENASRAAPAERPIELSAVALDGSRVALDVLDLGPGFLAERTGAGAEPAPRPAAEGGGGGLGLTIVRQLAAASGGSLELANRPGGGARARLVLPAFVPVSVPAEVAR